MQDAETDGSRQAKAAHSGGARPLIELVDVTVRYGAGASSVLAVEGLSLAIPKTGSVTSIGRSGCGKSSVQNLMAGSRLPIPGRVEINGQPIVGPEQDRMVVHQQTTTLLLCFDAERNVALALTARGKSKAEAREGARHYLSIVGLSGFESTPIYMINRSVDEALYVSTEVVSMSARPGRILHRQGFDYNRATRESGNSHTRASLEGCVQTFWSARVRLEMADCKRDLALFNLDVHKKLRGCDLVRPEVSDVYAANHIKEPASTTPSIARKPQGCFAPEAVTQYDISSVALRETAALKPILFSCGPQADSPGPRLPAQS